jgi:hypothetical protein
MAMTKTPPRKNGVTSIKKPQKDRNFYILTFNLSLVFFSSFKILNIFQSLSGSIILQPFPPLTTTQSTHLSYYNPLEKRHMVMVYITFVRYSVAKDKRLSSYFSSLKRKLKIEKEKKKEILPI